MWIGFCRKMKVEAFTFVRLHKWVDNVCRDGNGLVVHFEKHIRNVGKPLLRKPYIYYDKNGSMN